VTGFFISMLGALLFYSKSKYFPNNLKTPFLSKIPSWPGFLLLAVAGYIYYATWGPALGLLIFLTAVPPAYCVVCFLFNIRRSFAVSLLFILLVFLSIDLLS